LLKSTAVSLFENVVLPGVIAAYSESDKVAIRTAWNDWTDGLCKSGEITQRQYENWMNPFE
jgi:hypothetical protein